MTNTLRLLQDIGEAEQLNYSLDKYADYGVLEIYSDQLDAEQLKNKLLKDYSLTDIIVKEIFDGKKSILFGDCPSKLTVIENDYKFIVELKSDDVGLPLSKVEVRNLLKEYSSGKDVLDLFSYTGHLSIYCRNAKSLSAVESETKYVQKLKKNFEMNSIELPQIWDVNFRDFIDLAIESRTKWDLIVMDLSSYNLDRIKDFNLNTDHMDLIKEVQRKLLKEAGFLMLLTDKNDFVLNQYIRPGADKLTNKLIPEGFKPLKPNHIYVFYN